MSTHELSTHELSTVTGALQATRPRLSLCMIVRDSMRTLNDCLASIQPWVNDMVVVDTGSQDRTPEIARGYGARVFEFPWCDDFSAARNESVRHANGEWIFWMDSDDSITPECGRRLRALAAGEHSSSTLGYVMQVHCPDSDCDMTVVDHIKLFRNLPDLRFEGRIHEQILPAIRRLGGEVAWSDIYVTHSGSDQSSEGRLRKYERDLRILTLDLRERPNHPFVLFNLGMTHADRGNHVEAAGYLEQCLAASASSESHVRKAYALLIQSLIELDRIPDAWTVCQGGRQLFPSDPELLFRHAMLAHSAGRLNEAAAIYREVLNCNDERHFSSIDVGITGYKARHNLAVVYSEMGRGDLAELQWRLIFEERPQYLAGQRGLVRSLLQQRRYRTAEIALDRFSWPACNHAEESILRAEVAEARHNLPLARQLLETALLSSPTNLPLNERWCQFLFEHGELSEVERALQQLVEQHPDHAAAYYNLGLVCIGLRQHQEALNAFDRSLRLRPNSPRTRQALIHAMELRNAGQCDQRHINSLDG